MAVRVELLPPEFISQQIGAVAEDFEVSAAKTGALGSAEIIEAVTVAIEAHAFASLVVDPVMISKHGDPLLAPGANDALKTLLLRGPHSSRQTSTRRRRCSAEPSGTRTRCATRLAPYATSEPKPRW